MEINAATIGLFFLVVSGLTGFITFIITQRSRVKSEAQKELTTDKDQDQRIKVLETKFDSLQHEFVEMKQSQVNLETKLFTAINDLGKKLDNLIQTLLNK